MGKIDYDQLRLAIRNMKRWQIIYKLLKEELTSLGYWRMQARGNPKDGYNKGMGKHKRRF